MVCILYNWFAWGFGLAFDWKNQMGLFAWPSKEFWDHISVLVQNIFNYLPSALGDMHIYNSIGQTRLIELIEQMFLSNIIELDSQIKVQLCLVIETNRKLTIFEKSRSSITIIKFLCTNLIQSNVIEHNQNYSNLIY